MLKVFGVIMVAASLVVFKVENHGRKVEERPIKLDLKCDTLFVLGLILTVVG